MRIHLIIDFQYNFYRNKSSFDRRLAMGRASRLSSVVDGEVVDTTYMYLTLKDIESYRKTWLLNKDKTENEVYVSLAVDSKTDRKDMDGDYKSNRDHKLDESDYESINRTIETLRQVGYNIYKEEGCEADDLIRGLVRKFEDDFDLTVIYTNDSDILVNLGPKVVVVRFKSNLKKHVIITENTFSALMGEEFKCDMPLNSIMLFKSLVGDKSDAVKGVKGFGPKAYDKLIDTLREIHGADYFENLKYSENTEKCLNECHAIGRLSDFQLEEALHSFSLVKYKELDFNYLKTPLKADTDFTREKAYMRYAMKSLLK